MGQQHQAAASQVDGSEHAGSTSSGRVQPDSAFDRVLEELAAQGLAEHPAELEGSSTLAGHRLAEQEAGGRAGAGGSQAQRPGEQCRCSWWLPACSGTQQREACCLMAAARKHRLLLHVCPCTAPHVGD